MVDFAFQVAEVVFFVGQDMSDENHTTLKENLQDESVLIPTNIDHNVLTDEVSGRIIGSEVGELFPVRLLGASVPAIKGRPGVWIIFPELPESSPADDTYANDL